jgi:nitrite reductase (NO-forming)
MRTIGPGQSLVYQFRATHAGIWMYHCGTAPVLHHVGNGMYGAVIIDPPDLQPVQHEFVFVQSELYKDGTSEAGFKNMLARNWSAVMFNGFTNQYMDAPIRVEPAHRIRAWVLDAGPSEDTSFHVIGTMFDTVYKEGHFELQRGSPGASQTLDLQPAQGGFVEFVLPERGTYPFLTHNLADASAGAQGLFQAGPPTPGATAGH